MKEHIDFYAKREALHKEMYNAIIDMMKEHGTTEIDLRDYKTDDAYLINSTLSPAVEEIVTRVRLNDGLLEARTVDSEDYDCWLDLNDDVLLASFSTLYDVIYLILEK